jgi:hypothetical protein
MYWLYTVHLSFSFLLAERTNNSVLISKTCHFTSVYMSIECSDVARHLVVVDVGQKRLARGTRGERFDAQAKADVGVERRLDVEVALAACHWLKGAVLQPPS